MKVTSMNSDNINKTEIALEKLIRYYATKYYNGEDGLSDYEFDQLVNKLRSINPEHPILHTVGWGYTI